MLRKAESSTKIPTESAFALTPKDVENLLNAKRPGEARGTIATKLAISYQSDLLTPNEALLAEQIFRLFVHDTELSIRELTAHALKSSRRLPHDIALVMARDVESVALPVLQYSEVLTELDLIDLVRETKAEARHVAIARRQSVPVRLAETLCEHASPLAMTALFANKGAEITQALTQAVMQRHHDNASLNAAIARRTPPRIAEKVTAAISGELTNALQKKHASKAKAVLETMTEARESATLILIAQTPEGEETERLVQQLITFGRMSPALLAEGLLHGHIEFFERGMAAYADVPASNARKLLRDQGALGFRAIYNKSGLQEPLFKPLKMLFMATQHVQETFPGIDGSAFAQRMREHLNAQGETIEKILACLR